MSITPLPLQPEVLKMDTIKEKVQQGTYSLFAKENVRSIVWQRFRGIFNERGEEIFGVSCCSHCHTCIRYKSIKNEKIKDFGTKNLRDHMLYCGVPRKWIKKDFSDAQRMSSDGSENTICKVEILDEDFLDQIHNQVTQMDVAPVSPANLDSQGSSASLGTLPNPLPQELSFTKDPMASPETPLSPSPSLPPTPIDPCKEDEHDVFGRHVANELRSLPGPTSRRWARFQIQKVLFDAHYCERL